MNPTSPKAISLAPDGEERTRTDLVTYASQFVSASLLAGETLFNKLPFIINPDGCSTSRKRIELMRDQARERYISRLAEMLQKLPLNPHLIGFSETNARRYDALVAKMKGTPSEEDVREFHTLSSLISQKLASPLVYNPDLKKYLVQAKEEICSLTKQAADLFELEVISIASQTVPENQRSQILLTLKTLFPREMNKERARTILAAKEWRQDVRTDFLYHIHDRKHEGITGQFISSFQAAGAPYSSQFPRSRTPAQACLINFFFTSFTDRENSLLQLTFRSTRSGTLVESNQTNKALRLSCTLKNIEQLAHTHAEDTFRKMQLQPDITLKGQGTAQDPFILPLTLITLLTPDFEVHIKSLLGKIPQADDGRLLLNDLISMYKHFQSTPLIIPVGPKEHPTYIKIDLRYINIPSKEEYTKKQQSPLLKFFVQHKASERLLTDTISKLTQEAKELEKKLSLSIHTNPVLQPILQLLETKKQLRAAITKEITSTKKAPSRQLIEQWQRISDSIVEYISNELVRVTTGPECKRVLSICLKASLVDDLASDLLELAPTQIYKNTATMNGNRFGFCARILMLTSLLSQGSHFSCNSGKDRTGLEDDELKLLLAETSLSNRLPAWFEQISWRHHRLNRKNVALEAGNGLFNTKINLGGVAWWTLRGNRVELPKGTTAEEQQEDRELNAAYDLLEAASSITMKVDLKDDAVMTPSLTLL